MDEHIAEGSNRVVGMRFEKKTAVPSLPFEGLTASVMDMEGPGGLHGP
ncbi:hypothetical protein [Arthrobacter sp. TB 26]|nr:hypothetical protein [Arthrobacter sp. TB 26]